MEYIIGFLVGFCLGALLVSMGLAHQTKKLKEAIDNANATE